MRNVTKYLPWNATHNIRSPPYQHLCPSLNLSLSSSSAHPMSPLCPSPSLRIFPPPPPSLSAPTPSLLLFLSLNMQHKNTFLCISLATPLPFNVYRAPNSYQAFLYINIQRINTPPFLHAPPPSTGVPFILAQLTSTSGRSGASNTTGALRTLPDSPVVVLQHSSTCVQNATPNEPPRRGEGASLGGVQFSRDFHGSYRGPRVGS